MRENENIDPEIFDAIITVLTAIAQLATLGIAWKSYRLHRSEHQQGKIGKFFREMRAIATDLAARLQPRFRSSCPERQDG